MNQEVLKNYIEKYKAGFEAHWDNERYKWECVKCFQDNWDINADNFYEMFTSATEKAYNLLASMNNFPRGMIQIYAEQDQEAVRNMFFNLFDESKEVAERVIKFQSDAQEICDRLSPGKQHYQRAMAITVYLWMRFPEKYDIFKYSLCKETALLLENDFVPKKGRTPENIRGNQKQNDEILAELIKDTELIELYNRLMDGDCYQDKVGRMLATDFTHYISVYLKEENDETKAKEVANEDDVNIPVEKVERNSLYTKEDFLSEVYMDESQYESLKNILMKKQNIILQGAPGVGKTFAAKRLAYSIMGVEDKNRVEFIQFHQNYSYEDFIMGYKPNGEGFELSNGIFYKFCQKASNNPELPYFFIIDEINRGNMSKIFGELLMLIEKDYRGTTATLAYNGLPFSVPKNLYIIGMMNTADRSLAMIDYALRRRFSFYAMEPGFESDGFRAYQASIDDDTFNDLIKMVINLNKSIIDDPSLGKGFCIGHSYFCGQKPAEEEELLGWMTSVVDYDIVPMLEEYWFDEPEKINKWRAALQGVFNS